MSEEKQKSKIFNRDNLILLIVIIWAVCMVVFRY
jgi:hypothetical protein